MEKAMLEEISVELKTLFSVTIKQSMDNFQKYLQENDVTPTQMNMMIHLYYLGSCEITRMTSLMETNKSAVSQLVDRMVSQNLLERVEVPGDRRSRELHLTAHGKSLVEGGMRARQEWFEAVCAEQPDDVQKEIHQALSLFNRVFSTGPGAG
jgi:DNA-binding MarR family transcriptional regulator